MLLPLFLFHSLRSERDARVSVAPICAQPALALAHIATKNARRLNYTFKGYIARNIAVCLCKLQPKTAKQLLRAPGLSRLEKFVAPQLPALTSGKIYVTPCAV